MMKYGIGLLVFLVVGFVFLTAQTRPAGEVVVPLSFFDAELAADNVKWVDVEKDQLAGELRGARSVRGETVVAFRAPLPAGTTSHWSFAQWLLENRRNATVGVTNRDGSTMWNVLIPLIPWVVIFGFIWIFVFRQLRKTSTKEPEVVRVFVVNQPGDAAQPSAPTPQSPSPSSSLPAAPAS
jgi:ATP-dependent Zn protease